MKTSQTVLHLSVMLAMALSTTNGTVYADDDSSFSNRDKIAQQQQSLQQNGNAQQLQNHRENVQLRHRISEPDNEQANRNRLEFKNRQQSTEVNTDLTDSGEQDSAMTPSHDRDRIRDRDNSHNDELIIKQSRKRQRVNQTTEEVTETEETFDNRFSFEDRSSGQGFNTSGSMYQSKGSSPRSGGTGMGSRTQVNKRGAGHGSGAGNGRH